MSLSPFEKAITGSVASVIANSVVYPLDLSKTLIQSQPSTKNYTKEQVKTDPELYANTIDCLRKLYKKKGLEGWYLGIASSLASTASSNFAYFFWYAMIRKVYETRVSKNQKSTFVELSLGAIAGALSQLIIMPISTVSTRQQTESKKMTFYETALKIINSPDGVYGLWSGLKVSLVLTANPSITYGTFERLRSILFSGKQILSPIESFSMGVFSKLIATVITMPLIVSKVMIQRKEVVISKQVRDPKTGEMKVVKEVKSFSTFQEALLYVYRNEGILGLWRGLMPQISKAVIVQGFLFMFKEQLEKALIVVFQLLKIKKRKALIK